MRPRLLPALALWLVVCATVAPEAQQLRKIGEMELSLVGLSATVDGARPAIPKNVASGVRILINGGGTTLSPAAAARLLGSFDIAAELSGPSFGETVTVHRTVTPASTETDLVLPLPAMAVSGEHTLSNLRIMSGGRAVLDLQPHSVPVDVVEQVLITSVRTRPLTLQEIKDKGIVLDSDDYLGFEFTLGVLLESKPVNIAFPVVFDRQGVVVPVPQSQPSLGVDTIQEPVFVPKLVPVLFKIPKLGPGLGLNLDFDDEDIKIPSLLVIPGEVGFLKQFFSAQLFVGNGTPATANLIVRNLKGTIELPKGLDATAGTPDDPLSLAETINGVQPLQMTIAGVGPDGKAGTDDDVTSLRAGEQGQAEFLVRGDLEGFHTLGFDITGTLDGLATGPIEITGRATGGVLVRNPFFDVSFTLPTVVRANEPFKLYATVTNKGQGIANDVSMTLDGASLSGVNLIGDGTKTIDTLKPGEAETLVFDFESLRTGQAVATYLRFEGDGATGSLKFKVGVGERGVPLSPDTLVLPAQVDALPEAVVLTAMRVLGQAWSIANTPPNAMPAGVARISKSVVTSKALALAEAGLRIRLGEPELDAIRDLLPDFYGPAPIDRGFDQLLRTTDAGRNFNRAVGAALAPDASANALALEAAFSNVAASGKDFVAFAIANGGAAADVDVALFDAANRALPYTGANSDARPAVTSAAIAPLGPPSSSPLFGVIAAPTASPYRLELTGRSGGPVDLSVTYPRGDGQFTRVTARGVTVPAGAKARIAIDPSRASPAIEIDTDANGTIDATVPLSLETLSASGPHLLSATVVGPETFDSAGPFGFNVALLFDRVVDESAAADLTHYSIPDNQFQNARRQLSGRLVFGALAKPEGPNIPSSVTVAGMTDLRGVGVGSESRPLHSLLVDPGAVVSGRVINGDGQLAAGVRVIYSINTSWKDCQDLQVRPVAETVTDASGRYQFHYVYRDPCGTGWGMQALDEINHADRVVTGSVRAPGERITADIALLGRGAVTGIVRGLNNAPVPGAQVIAVSTLESQIGGSATTDGDGRYTIFGITVGPISVKAVKGQSAGTAAALIARAGTTTTADVTLNQGTVSMSGIVSIIERGVAKPAAGAIVVFDGPDPLGSGSIIAGATKTAADGSYSFTELPAGPYAIRASVASGDNARLSGVTAPGDVITKNISIEVKRDGQVSGVVRYADGSIVPHPVVTLSSRGTVGEEDGSFTIEDVLIAETPQQIVAYSPDGLREGHSKVLINQPGQQLSNVVVTLNGIGTLDLVVIDSNGNPVRNQIVQIARTGMNISPTDCTAFYLAPTDDQGRVQFAGLDVGAVRAVSIRPTANGVDIAKLDATIPYEGATVTGVLRFGGGGSIRGIVRDDLGQPVFGANIEIFSMIYDGHLCQMVAGVSHRLRTNLNGEYRVTGVPVGSVRISASQEFFPTPVGANGVLARDGDELVADLQLIHTTAGKVTGKVFLPDGVTPAGAGVTVSAIGMLPEVLVTTNANGEYAFPKIFPAGGYTVTVRDAATGFATQDHISLTAGTDVVRDFRLRGRGTVSVKVVDGGNVPVSNALVTLTESDYPFERFEAVVESSNQGVVTFSNVHEGDFSVSASDVFARGGRISGALPSNGASIEVTVRLTVTGTVTGHFLMPDAVTAIPFGTVKLIAGGKVIGQVSTDSGDDAGRFSFAYVPAGTVRLEGLDPATGRSGIAIGQLTTDGQILTLDVRAQGLGTVTGVVTSNGVPQDGAHVQVSSGTFKAQTNADGNGVYSVPGVPEGVVTVNADLQGALPSTATGTLLGEGSSVTVDVALQPSGSIVGIVTAADGTTPAPLSIVTAQVGSTRFSTTTNDLGEYRFDLVPAGTRALSVDVIGSIDTAVGTVTVVGGQSASAPLQLIGVGGISGIAQTASGVPVGGTVTLTGTGVVGWSTTLTVAGDGSFTAAQVLAGPFTAQVRNTVGGITLYGTATGVVSPGGVTSIVVTLQSTGDVIGVVRRSDAATPAIGATVTLTGGTGSPTTQVFSDGSFAFRGLPLGSYAISVYDVISNGYARASGLVLAQNGDVANANVLVLDDTLPAVQSIAPADGATGVSRTQPVVVTFSDALANTSGVNVKKGTTTLGATRALSAEGRTLTLTSTWPDSSEITIEVTTSVTDLFGRHPATQVVSKFVTVDTTAPSVSSVSPVNDAIQIAGNSPIVVTFSEPIANADVNGLIAVTRAGTPITGTSVQGPANVVTFTPSGALAADAIYNVKVDGAIDATGNEQGAAFTSLFATADTVAPVLTISAPSQTTWLTDNTPFISVQRTDATSGIDTASGTLSIDGSAVTPAKSASALTFTAPTLSDGTHALAATSTDRAGNTGAVSGSIRIDATAPGVAAITDIGDGTTIVGTTTIAAAATDATSGVARIEIYRDASKILDLLPPFTGTWNAASTADGRYSLTARAVDNAGNVGPTSAPIDVVVNNSPLVVTITSPVANFRTRKPVAVTATVSEPATRVDFSLGTTTISDSIADSHSPDSYSALLPIDMLADGDATITVTAYDLLGQPTTQTRAIVIDRTSPVARWALDEGTGTTTADATGNGHTGTLIAGTAWSTLGQFGKAIALDGANGGIVAADHDDFDMSAAVSMSAWVLPSAAGSIQTLIEKSGTTPSYSLGIGPDGRAEAVIYPNGSAVVAQSVSALTPQLWSHLAATYDGTALKLFVNGTLIATTNASGPLPATEGAIYLGRSETGNVLTGRLDEVRIYDRALSAAEVSALAAATTAKTMLAGEFRGAFVAQPGGFAWAMGQHANGSLGIGSGSAVVPTPMATISDLATIAADNTHGLALTRAGVLYGWGSATNGVGDGTASIRTSPVPIALDNVVMIAAGTGHSGAVLANGDAYAWGDNSNGQLGDGTTTSSLVPKLVMTGVRAIAMSNNTTLFLKTNGTVWGAGVNSSGQLGNNATANIVSTPVQMIGITNAVAIATADAHSVVLLADGTVRGVGIGNRTGDGTSTSRTTTVAVTGLTGVVQIAANGGHTLARKSDGTVWAWGSNNSGELGDGTTTTRPAPVKAQGVIDAVDIGAGNDLSLAVTASGVVYTWGDNGFNELGDGTTRQRLTPVAISIDNYVWKTPTPQISDVSNTFFNNRVVTITNALTTNVSMYYTLNGAVPTPNDTPIAHNQTITIDKTETLMVKAFHATKPESNVGAETYTMVVGSISINPNFTTNVPAPQSYTLTTTTTGATIYYTLDGSDPTTSSPVYSTPFLLSTQTVVKAIAARAGFTPPTPFSRTVSFSFGAQPTPTIAPAGGSYAGAVLVTLNAMPGATIYYTPTNNSVSQGVGTNNFLYTGPFLLKTSALPLRARAFHPDYSASAEASASFTIQANPPQFSVAAGSYAAGTKVLVTGDQFATQVRYTIDGSDPTSTSTLVPAGGITIGNFTLKARAFQTGATDSVVTSATYTVTGQLAPAAMSAGSNHTMLSTADGRLFMFGSNFRGQLGDNTTTDHRSPIVVNDLPGVINVAAGDSFSVALTADGQLWTWGFNVNHQLGDGTSTQRPLPILLSSLSDVIAISAGRNHAVALRSNGEAYTWGNNGFGQLGDGTTTTNTPHLVMTGVMAVAAGGDQTLFVKTDGTVWGAGVNTSGQLGDGTFTNRSTPVPMTGVTGAMAVSAGNTFSVVLRGDGTLLAVGQGGRLGDNTTVTRNVAVPVVGISNVVSISASDFHALALKSDGTVWGWGASGVGELGNPAAAATQLTPIQAVGLSNVKAMAAGSQFSVAVTGDGVLYGWGFNSSGQLGDGSTRSRTLPTAMSDPGYTWKVAAPTINLNQSGAYFDSITPTILSSTPGAIIHYTSNGAEPTEADPVVPSDGKLTITTSQTLTAKAFKAGMPDSNSDFRLIEIDMQSPGISPGTGTYTSARTVTITNVSPGASVYYTLDNSDPTTASFLYTAPFIVGTTTTVKARAFRDGTSPSTIRTATYTMNFGTLATPVIAPNGGTFADSVSVTLTSAGAPPGTVIRYTTNGGTPGTTSTPYTGPFSITSNFSGSVTNVRAKAFNPDYTDSGIASANFTIQATAPTLSVPTGTYAPGTTFTVTDDPAYTIRYTLDGTDPTSTSLVIASGSTRVIGAFTIKLRAFKTGVDPSAVVSATYSLTGALGPGMLAGGIEHKVMVTPYGRVYAWGNGALGKIGDGSTSAHPNPTLVREVFGAVAVAAGSDHSMALTYDGTVYAWGGDGLGQVGDGTFTTIRFTALPVMNNAIAIAAGSGHSLAITSGGQLYAWGQNTNGQLGIGSTSNQSQPMLVSSLPPVVAVAGGNKHTVTLTADGHVYAWGLNSSGQVGDNSTTQRTTPVLLGLSDIASIAASGDRSYALRTDGKLFAWGAGASGALGTGATTNLLTPTALTHSPYVGAWTGDTYATALRFDGTLAAWGSDTQGQIGFGSTASQRLTPVTTQFSGSISTLFAEVHPGLITPAGAYYAWGQGNLGQWGDGTSSGTPRTVPQLTFTVNEPWAPAAPSFSVMPGTYANAVTLVVTTPMVGATIRYTIDGSAPTDASTEVPANGEILINQNLTIRARVFAPGRAPGAITSGAYVITP